MEVEETPKDCICFDCVWGSGLPLLFLGLGPGGGGGALIVISQVESPGEATLEVLQAQAPLSLLRHGAGLRIGADGRAHPSYCGWWQNPFRTTSETLE